MIGNKVPGHGPLPAKIMFVGEGPGANEAAQGIPFVGASGSELDWVFLRRAACLQRDEVYVTNIVKWRTDEEDRDPNDDEVARDQAELLAEIAVCNPQIIVAVGRIAAWWMFGCPRDKRGERATPDMEKYHGIPIACPRFPERTLLVAYHPAAGIRQPERYYHLTYWDFQQLGGVVRGEIQRRAGRRVPVVDVAPSHYDPPAGSVSVDTEGSVEAPWGSSWSTDPMQGYVVRSGCPSLTGRTVEAHNILHDVKVLRALGQEIDLRQCDDTMLMAYLFPWLPRALKPLMYKLCEMEQREYEEVIAPGETRIAKEYLEQVLSKKCSTCDGQGEVSVPYKRQPNKFRKVKCDGCGGDGTGWPLPQPQLVIDDHTAKGRIYKPRSVGRRVRELLVRGDNLRAGWEALDESLRAPVEAHLGPLREATLDDVDPDEANQYAGIDACGTKAVHGVLKGMIRREGLDRIYQIDKGILPMIDRMQNNGILIDPDHFRKLHAQFTDERQAVTEKLAEIAGYGFNPGSPVAVSDFLYRHLGLKGRGTGGTDEKTLEGLKLRYKANPKIAEAIDCITDYRELSKLEGTYVQPLLSVAKKNWRVYTRFLLHVTTSGRLSSRDPNLQNIPTRTERGRLIRQGFIAAPTSSLVSVDLDQIELRVAAHLSEDPNMIEVFSSGKDIHRATASLIYKKPMEAISTQERLLSKTINFGILYGMSAKRLFKELNLLGIEVTLDDCVSFINQWFAAYPGVKDYMDRCWRQAHELGYVECLFGRRRYLPGVYSTIEKVREESRRWAVNHPDQGTAAAILKIWMARVWDHVLPVVQRAARVEPLLTVHDELIFECEKGAEDLLIGMVVAEASQAVELYVPIAAKGGYGHSWNDLK